MVLIQEIGKVQKKGVKRYVKKLGQGTEGEMEGVLNESLESVTELYGFRQEDPIEAEVQNQNFNQAVLLETEGLPGDFRGFGAEDKVLQEVETQLERKNVSGKERRKRKAGARSR